MSNSRVQSHADQILAVEKELGAHNYKPLDVISVTRCRGLGVGYRRSAVYGLIIRLFGR
jgi:hypothetical protein